jgi:hypothetical protein
MQVGAPQADLEIEMHNIVAVGQPVIGEEDYDEENNGYAARNGVVNQVDDFEPKEDIFDNFAEYAELGNVDSLTRLSLCCMKTARFLRVQVA